MKTLYLLRHAHTLEDPPAGGADRDRCLSPHGEEQARLVGAFMKKNGFIPSRVLHSSATRTTQTAALVLAALGQSPAMTADDSLYHASASHMMATAQEMDDTVDSLLMVVHNPGVAELAMRLGDVSYYPPATLCVFTADVAAWRDMSEDTVTLEAVFTPKA